MKRPGTLTFLAAAAFFAVFCANVVKGASGAGVFLGDVWEMLMLFAAVICFVAGILAREAAERPAKTGQTS